jgi:hypothetical protein
MCFYRELLLSYPDVQAVVATSYDTFVVLLDEEGELIDAMRSSPITKLLKESDRRIDRNIVGINNMINSGMHHFDPEKVAAANQLRLRMKAFGNIESKSYIDESAAVKILIRDMRNIYSAQVTLLELDGWIDELDSAQVEFETLFIQRNSERAAKPVTNVKPTRKAVTKIYYDMTEVINASAVLDTMGIFVEFITQLNEELQYAAEHTPHHARKDIEHVTVTEIPTQTYTGKPVVYIPQVFFTEEGKPTVELVFAKDFTVTYKNNTKVGTATLIIHGKGAYRGTKTVTFNIAAQIEN